MKAIVLNRYGSPDVLELKEIEKSVVKDDGVLVRVHAAALNAGDVFSMKGSPWLVRFAVGFPKPKDYVLGWDMAGRVEAVEKPQEGKIIAAGPGKWDENGKRIPLEVKKDDRVLFGKYSGNEITIDGVEHLIMREDDILGIIGK